VPTGVDWYSVSTDVRPDEDNYPPSRWLDDEGWSLPVLLDDDAHSLIRATGLTAFPYTIVVDGSGAVVGRGTGAIPIEELVGFTEQLS
jgi:hypothetical protein